MSGYNLLYKDLFFSIDNLIGFEVSTGNQRVGQKE